MAKTSVLIGDGLSTQFDVDTGFDASKAIAQLFDANTGTEVMGFQLIRLVPNSTSVRLILTPAPALNAVQARISDGTEPP